jgi:Flp pilus assembly protein TadD
MTPKIEEITARINADPADAWLYHERGWALLGAGQKALAIEDFDAAIALDKSEPQFRLGRGWVYECLA